MAARAMNGTEVARRITTELRRRAEVVRRVNAGRPPTLAAVAVDDGPGTVRFLRMKEDACRAAAMELRPVLLPPAATTGRILGAIDGLNRDPEVDGVFLQYPLPPAIDARSCFDRIDPAKDVDGAGAVSLGRLAAGEEGFVPATAAGILRLLTESGVATAGRRAVVVSGEPLVARPLMILLLDAGATVTACGHRHPGLAAAIGEADLVVAATGRPAAIDAAWIPDGAVLVDAGYYHPGRTGEVRLGTALDRLAAYTPVTGGVGPMTIAMLLHHTLLAAERRA